MKIVEKSDVIRAAMEKVMGIFLGDTDAVFANVDCFEEVREDLEAGKPVIFYGMASEASIRLQGNPAAPWFYAKNSAYFRVVFELPEMVAMYYVITRGEKVENRAVMLAAKLGHQRSLVNQLLHNIRPYSVSLEKELELARKEFGITGSIEEVRAELGKLQTKGDGRAKEFVGDEIIPGVFFDIEGTVLYSDHSGVNQEVMAQVQIYEKNGKPITFWTGADVREIERLLFKMCIKKYPVVSKDLFRGCRVELVYDDLPEDEFREEYGIVAEKYIQIHAEGGK